MRPFFKDQDFQFATENVLGGAFHRAADVGEVLATIDHIPNGKAAAWVEQWTATADRLAAEAAANAAAGRHRSAAAQYLRAANYYSEASDKADATPDPALFTALWEKHRNAWDRFVDLSVESGTLDVERIAIPYEGTTLPGYFFRARARREPRPHGHLQQRQRRLRLGAWGRGGVAAARPRLVRPDLRRPRAARRALSGRASPSAPTGRPSSPRSSTSCWPAPDVDAAADRRHRRQPGRLLGAARRRLRAPLRRRRRRPGRRRRLHAMARSAARPTLRHAPRRRRARPSSTGTWAGRLSLRPALARAWPCGCGPTAITSLFDLFTAVREYRLTTQRPRSRCPMLVTDPEDEQFWPGQSQRSDDR